MCDIKEIPDSFFKNGMISSSLKSELRYRFKILSHIGNIIEIENDTESILFAKQQIILTPKCDKSFGTCCNFFNNAVNFRGEPTIPEANIIKN